MWDMIIVQGSARVSAKDYDRFKAFVVPIIEASRQEEGCILYAFASDLTDPTLIRITERWASQAALDSHLQQPHFAKLIGELGNYEVSDLVVMLYDASNERPLG
jgi:quinol monooxygenase YgiN